MPGSVGGAILLAAIIAGCGGSSQQADQTVGQRPGTLGALWKGRPGEDVGLVQGTSDYARGPIRVSFLVVRGNGQAVERPRARVWVARGLEEKPFLETEARLEPVGVPGDKAGEGDVRNLFVTQFRVPEAGKYWLVAEPVGGRRIQGLATLVVREEPQTPAVGARAIPSDNPTIRSTGGDFSRLTTASPPDRELLRYSVAETLAARKPFVVAFATPKFCASRTCGPTVDVVDHVRRQFRRSDVRFIHVEIYTDNDPQRGVNAWVREWKLPSEPWVFVVGRDGRISAKFEGSVSAAELARAVRALS